jgi:hypothetical protein
MSVWKFPCYVDDVLENICASFDYDFILNSALIQASDFDIGDFGDFVVPKGLKSGNLYNQVKNETIDIKQLYKTIIVEDVENNSLYVTLSKIKELRFGLKEVYRKAHEFIKLKRVSDNVISLSSELARQLFCIGELASYQGPYRIVTTEKKLYPEMIPFLNKLDDLKRYASHVKAVVRNRRYNKKIDADMNFGDILEPYDLPKHIKDIFPNNDIILYKNLYFSSDDDWETATVLTTKDIDRFYQIARGMLIYKMSLIQFNDTIAKTVGELVYEIFLKSLLVKRRANYLCRSWDIVYNTVLARIANDINDRAEILLRAKYYEEKLNDFIDIDKIIYTVEKAKIKDRIDLLYIYKCLPTSDFDYFSVMNKQKELYEKQNVLDTKIDVGMKDLIAYYKYMMVRAYKKRHGTMPGRVKEEAAYKEWHSFYPKISLKGLNYHMVDDLDLDGAFKYKSCGYDIMKHVKDSAIIPKRDPVNGYELNKVPVDEKNMLLDVFMRQDDINVKTINYDTARINVKAEDKAEAKKPYGRLFFEADTDIRIKHSEYEANLAKYLKHIPGCAVGLKKREMIAKLNQVTFVDINNLNVKHFIMSFDLAKFSPHFPGDVHKIFDEVNANLFGEPDLKNAYKIHQDGNIVYYKKSIRHVIKKPNADLEGMSGKFNTIFHAVVMGLAVNALRESNMIIGSAQLATFIDDGLLNVKVDRDSYDIRVKEIIQVIDDIYRRYGLEISYDKTFISSVFAVFLHRIYYSGRELTSVTKAMMKMDNFSDKPAASILDDIGLAESTARASLSAGSVHTLVYAYYVYLVVDALRKWNVKEDQFSFEMAVWCFSPVSLGGLGVRSVLALCGSTAYDIQHDFFSVIFQVKRRIPQAVPIFNKIMNQEMSEKAFFDRITGARVVKTRAKVINGFRFSKLMENLVQKFVSERNRLNFFKTERKLEYELVPVMLDSRIPSSIIKRVYESSPDIKLHNIAIKFLRSRTAHKLVSKKEYNRIIYANMNDVRCWVGKMVRFNQ